MSSPSRHHLVTSSSPSRHQLVTISSPSRHHLVTSSSPSPAVRAQRFPSRAHQRLFSQQHQTPSIGVSRCWTCMQASTVFIFFALLLFVRLGSGGLVITLLPCTALLQNRLLSFPGAQFLDPHFGRFDNTNGFKGLACKRFFPNPQK